MIAFARKNLALLTKNMAPEVCIISYPKSGRTWLRCLIGKYLCENAGITENRMLRTRYMTSAAGLLRAQFTHDGSATIENKSHEHLSAEKNKYKDLKVILLGRDIKDTLVSSYFQTTRREEIFEGTIADFIRSKNFGAVKILKFYRQWYEQQNIPDDFLFIRYEDLHEHPEAVLKKVLFFLGATDVSQTAMRSAIEFCHFKNLKKIETQRKFNSGILSAADKNDPDSFKMRKGLVGNYRTYLSDDDIEYIHARLNQYSCGFTHTAGTDGL